MRIELWHKDKMLAVVAVGEQPQPAKTASLLDQNVNTYEYGSMTVYDLLKKLARETAKAARPGGKAAGR